MFRLIQVVTLVLCLFVGGAFASSWSFVSRSSGITVHRQDVPGSSLPLFRGAVVFNESIFDILAVLQDFSRYVEWMHDCREAERLVDEEEWTTIAYIRIDAPWPLRDRDVVVKSMLRAYPEKRRVRISIEGVDLKNRLPVEGVVRVAPLSGAFELESLDDKRTRVEFTILADPGGSLPKWVASMVSRYIPLYTLRNLQRQVEKTRGKEEYRPFILRAKSVVGG